MSELTPFTSPQTLNTAVLFLVFNRLDSTRQVFEAIRRAKPPRLYIAADGARRTKKGEAEKVQAVRDHVIQNIDWVCDVKTLFHDHNIGCRYAVSGAITWFFENEEQGIILEDDCLPSQSFFWYCEELLELYKNDLRIWHISGSNFRNSTTRENGSYYFSKFNHIWGWASWANRWKEYDVELKSYKHFLDQNIISNLSDSEQEQRYWQFFFQKVVDREIDTWDYQWTYTVWVNNGLSILPNVNLISNIGFGPEATHTTDLDSQYSRIPRLNTSVPLKHPFFLVRDAYADKCMSLKMFRRPSLLRRVFNRLKKAIN